MTTTLTTTTAPAATLATQPATSYINEFLAYLDAAEVTKQTYLKALKNFATFCSNNNIEQVTRRNLIEYKEYLKSKYSTNTVNLYIMAVKQLFNYLEACHNMPNPARGIKKEKQAAGFKKDILTPEEIKQALSTFDVTTEVGARNYAIFLLMITTALRCNEVINIDVRDLRKNGAEYVLNIKGKGETDKTRFIAIDAAVIQAVNAYQAFKPTALKENGSPLFTSVSNNNHGGRLTTKTVSTMVKSTFKSIGLDSDRLTAHSTRHTAITLALLNGATVQQAAQFARHANINTTLIYAHNLEQAENPCTHLVTSAIF